jgi:hypothetical protein
MPLTNGSGSGSRRPKNIRIRRIRNTGVHRSVQSSTVIRKLGTGNATIKKFMRCDSYLQVACYVVRLNYQARIWHPVQSYAYIPYAASKCSKYSIADQDPDPGWFIMTNCLKNYGINLRQVLKSSIGISLQESIKL